MKNHFHQVGAVFYALWALLHVAAGASLVASALGDINGHLREIGTGATPAQLPVLADGTVISAIIAFHSFNMIWIGGIVGFVAVRLNWRNSPAGHWLNLALTGFLDVGLFVFLLLPVGRSLEPELQAALLLREVDEMTNLEAAKTLGLSESVFRHRLSEARETMERAFDGLCALVNKRGACYQCSGLREAVPEPSRQGEPAPQPLPLQHRLRIVRECDTDAGRSQPLHDLFWRRIAEQERAGRGAVEPSADCVSDGDRG